MSRPEVEVDVGFSELLLVLFFSISITFFCCCSCWLASIFVVFFSSLFPSLPIDRRVDILPSIPKSSAALRLSYLLIFFFFAFQFVFISVLPAYVEIFFRFLFFRFDRQTEVARGAIAFPLAGPAERKKKRRLPSSINKKREVGVSSIRSTSTRWFALPAPPSLFCDWLTRGAPVIFFFFTSFLLGLFCASKS